MNNLIFAILVFSNMTQATNYKAERAVVEGDEVIRLTDAAHGIEVSIAPAFGNNAYEMKVNGKDIVWSPYRTLKELSGKPIQIGNPFLAPWANRIDGDAYWANGKKYLLNSELKSLRYDLNRKPIHGLLVYAKDWQVESVKADGDSASVTSRLEFWRRPDWIAQIPFAHNLRMTYRLESGILEVETAIENLSTETMPLSLGYHTYYRIESATRDDWSVHVSACDHVMLSDMMIPTGERKPAVLSDPQTLRGLRLDDVFTTLIRDSAGRAEFWVQGKNRRSEFA
jgi:aldose 1-epimerase